MTTRELAEALARDATTPSFKPSTLDVLDWVNSGDLRFANFLPLRAGDPRLEQLRQLLLPSGDRS